MKKKIFQRMGLILAGYFLACLASTIIGAAYMFLFSRTPLYLFLDVIVFIAVVVAVAAIVPATIFIVICEIKGHPGWRGHLIAGMACSVPALIYFLFIADIFRFPSLSGIYFGLAAMFTGAVAGLVYWKISVAPLKKNLIFQVRPTGTMKMTALL